MTSAFPIYWKGTRRAILALALLATPSGATMSPAAKTMEWKGAFCRQAEPEAIVAKSAHDWAKVWEKIGKAAPEADFNTHFAVAVFAGQRPTGGWSVSWQQEGAVIRYRWLKPKGMAMQVITQPYDVRLFSNVDGPVKVEALSGD